MLQELVSDAPTLGRYRILGELGRGAMGIVYRAVDPLLDRTVAIKTLNLSEALDEATECDARFQLEAKAGGRLAHPNIITVYDVGREGDVAFMTMEFLEGRELRSLIAQHGRLPVWEAIRIAAQVADGLAYAHEHGVTHRDIKPGNIMILGSGLAKIMDFGIARLRSSDVRTKTGILLGSPKYMSAEQVLGQGVDGRSDIFSLGVVLYEMLTGSAPFTGNTVSNLMYQIATAPALPPSRANAGVPQMLDFIVAKALAKDPAERYQSAAELAADLRQCADGLARSPRPSAQRSDTALAATLALAPEGEGTRVLPSRLDPVPATSKTVRATGVQRPLDAGTKTKILRREEMSLSAAERAAAGPNPEHGAHPAPASEWTWAEKLMLGVGVTVGVVVAAFIALA